MARHEPGADAAARRRFLLSDGIVLVAAAGVMLSADRALRWLWVRGDPTASYNELNMKLMAWTLALIGLSLVLLISNLARAGDRRRLRQGVPGLFVPVAAATVLVARIAGWAAQSALAAGVPGVYPVVWARSVMGYLLAGARLDVAIGVVAAWLALGVAGRWCPDRAWDDRLGRCLGVLRLLIYLGAPLIGLLR